MSNSAMLRAFQILKQKPLLILLLIPMQLLQLITVLLMPDMSRFFDFNSLMQNSSRLAAELQSINALSSLSSWLTILLSLVLLFLLIPPALELLRDGAAGKESPAGWYSRGLRSHWWKPLVTTLIEGGIYIGVFLAIYFVVIGVVMKEMPNWISQFSQLDQFDAMLPTRDAINRVFALILPTVLSIVGVIVLIVYTVKWIIDSLFGLLLPATADHKFADAVLLVFSRKGQRCLPKFLGGYLLLGVLPVILWVALGAEFWMTNGQPVDFWGAFTLLSNYIRSWEYIVSILILGFFNIMTYAFRFAVYQQLTERDSVESV